MMDQGDHINQSINRDGGIHNIFHTFMLNLCSSGEKKTTLNIKGVLHL